VQGVLALDGDVHERGFNLLVPSRDCTEWPPVRARGSHWRATKATGLAHTVVYQEGFLMTLRRIGSILALAFLTGSSSWASIVQTDTSSTIPLSSPQ
jgi:hypothetical protein